MYAYLKGKAQLSPTSAKGENASVELWIDVNGVGYSVWVAAASAARVNWDEEQVFYVSQSSAMYGGETTLYGFLSLADKALFDLFRELPGVGAKKALEYFEKVSAKSAEKFLEAVIRGDAKFITTFFKFTPKVADKIAAELREKATALSGQNLSRRSDASKSSSTVDVSSWVDGRLWETARTALISLGFNVSDVESALNAAAESSAKDKPTLEGLVRAALQNLTAVK